MCIRCIAALPSTLVTLSHSWFGNSLLVTRCESNLKNLDSLQIWLAWKNLSLDNTKNGVDHMQRLIVQTPFHLFSPPITRCLCSNKCYHRVCSVSSRASHVGIAGLDLDQ